MRKLPILLTCLLLAACGGSDGDGDSESGIYDDADTTSGTSAEDTGQQAAPPASSDEPRSLARNAVVALETCFAETQDYSRCDTEEELDDPELILADPAAEKPEPGQVQIPEAGPDEYTVKTIAEDGTLFTIAGSGGAMSRVCAPPGQSGCGEDGRW